MIISADEARVKSEKNFEKKKEQYLKKINNMINSAVDKSNYYCSFYFYNESQSLVSEIKKELIAAKYNVKYDRVPDEVHGDIRTYSQYLHISWKKNEKGDENDND